METRPGIESLCCVNAECKDYGRRGQENVRVRKVYGRDQIRYLRCKSCGEEFSERKGTALYQCKIAEVKAVAVIDHVDSGCGVNVTARLVGVNRGTVSRLIKHNGRVDRQLHDGLVQGITPRVLEFDEKWSYTGHKHHTEADGEGEGGDRWDVNCLDPETKLLISVIPGPRTAETITASVADAHQRLQPGLTPPAIFTDGEAAYVDAIRHVFGTPYPAPRSSHRGRPPLPIIRIPQSLVYTQIVKHRSGQRVVKVDIRPVFGKSKLPALLHRLGWHLPNTSAIERFNLTDRTRNCRKARKTICFSKSCRVHDATTFISALRYNFHHCHRSLQLKLEDGSILKRTPAMAAGLSSHPFSTLELLRLCPVGLR